MKQILFSCVSISYKIDKALYKLYNDEITANTVKQIMVLKGNVNFLQPFLFLFYFSSASKVNREAIKISNCFTALMQTYVSLRLHTTNKHHRGNSPSLACQFLMYKSHYLLCKPHFTDINKFSQLLRHHVFKKSGQGLAGGAWPDIFTLIQRVQLGHSKMGYIY